MDAHKIIVSKKSEAGRYFFKALVIRRMANCWKTRHICI